MHILQFVSIVEFCACFTFIIFILIKDPLFGCFANNQMPFQRFVIDNTLRVSDRKFSIDHVASIVRPLCLCLYLHISCCWRRVSRSLANRICALLLVLQIATLRCVPPCPHFAMTFWNSSFAVDSGPSWAHESPKSTAKRMDQHYVDTFRYAF